MVKEESNMKGLALQVDMVEIRNERKKFPHVDGH